MQMIIIIILRVLSGDPTGYGAATSRVSHAENVVYRLSGMYEFVVNDAPEQAEDAGPAEPVSAGKCSTVS